jgi:LemA protein
MDQLSGTENRIAVERIRYNECVQAYNTLRRQCRSDITADPFSLDANWVLFAAHEATETVPQVNFSPGT